MLVIPLVVIIVFAVIDMGLYMWQWNLASKATQRGARIAVVAPPVTGAIVQSTWDPNEIGNNCRDTATGAPRTDGGGAPLCSDFGVVECRSGGCSNGDAAGASFGVIAGEIIDLLPVVTQDNVVVRYESLGLGFVGRPGGNPVLVTVYLECATTDLIVLDFLAGLTRPAGCPGTGSSPIPAFPTSLISESFGEPT